MHYLLVPRCHRKNQNCSAFAGNSHHLECFERAKQENFHMARNLHTSLGRKIQDEVRNWCSAGDKLLKPLVVKPISE